MFVFVLTYSPSLQAVHIVAAPLQWQYPKIHLCKITEKLLNSSGIRELRVDGKLRMQIDAISLLDLWPKGLKICNSFVM